MKMIVNNEIVGYKYHYECEECDLKEMNHIIFSYFPRYFYQFSHGFSHLVDFPAAPKETGTQRQAFPSQGSALTAFALAG
jgi:hypothetical protein